MIRYLAVPAVLLLFASCQEKGPLITLTEPVDTTAADSAFRTYDSTYSITPEAPQQRVVLIEEFTGVTCPQCPAGHTTLKTIAEANPGRVAIVGIQPIGNAQSRPYAHGDIKTKHDNRTEAGTSIGSAIYGGIAALPQAGIDRINDGGTTSALFLRTDWPSRVDTRMKLATKANVSISTYYSEEKRRAAITVKVSYTGDVTLPQKLTVAITEDQVVDVQELSESPGYNKDYTHEHVLRAILTLPSGDAILKNTGSITAGKAYQRTFDFKVPDTFNPDNLHVVAFVSNADPVNQEVLQAAHEALK